jgi:hypothetical protein
MTLVNIDFSNDTAASSASLASLFFAIFIAFPMVHTYQCYQYNKKLKENDVKGLQNFKYELLFGEFEDTNFIRYFYYWAFCLRRILNAVVILFM